jgi:heme exporter protein B
MLVAAKDLRIELRSRVLLWQVVPFGVMALMLTGLAMGPNSQNAANLAPGMFYLVLLFVVILTVSRAFAIESPVGTSQSTKMLGLDPAGVFLGKASAIFLQLLLVGSVLLLGAATLQLPKLVDPCTVTFQTISWSNAEKRARQIGAR